MSYSLSGLILNKARHHLSYNITDAFDGFAKRKF